jgi:uncharacterized protein (TIGR02246 family)
MKRSAIANAFTIAAAAALAVPAAGADQSQDEAAIRQVEAGFTQAWNAHDAKALANLFTEDADVVNVVGWWWHGRSQIDKKLTDAHGYIFRDSILIHNEIHIRFPTPEIALVHVRWLLVGAKNPKDGTPGQPRKGIETQVVQKQAGKWLIAAFHNTDSVPEAPFPTGPPKK